MQFAMVYFESAVLAVAALMGGHVDAAMGGAAATLGAVKSGQICVLGLTNTIGNHLLSGCQDLVGIGV